MTRRLAAVLAAAAVMLTGCNWIKPTVQRAEQAYQQAWAQR